MAAEPTATINPPAPEAQAPPSQPPSGTATQPASAPGDDSVLASLLKHKQALEADNKKLREKERERDEKAAAEKQAFEAKLKEQGDFAKLYDSEKEKRTALEAQIAALTPKAERLTAHEQRIADKLAAAKAKGDLPSHIVRAIDIAAKVDVDEAFDILSEHLASIGTGPAPKQPAPPAPPQGGAPAAQPAPLDLKNPSVADLQKLKTSDPVAHARLISGRTAPAADVSFGARLAGAFRK